MGLTATAPTRTRTSPDCGTGCGRSPERITSGPPVVSRKAAFTMTRIPRVSRVFKPIGKIAGGGEGRKGRNGLRPALLLPESRRTIPIEIVPRPEGSILGHAREAIVMQKTDTLVEYGAPIDPQIMVTPPDVTELELEPGHPGLGDQAYINRRKELFALCRKHRLDNLGPPIIAYTP